jgi:hypothetical protein
MSPAGGTYQPVSEWLASPEHPAARYLYARDIAHAAPDALERRRRAMLTWQPLRQLLDLQLPDGSFPPHEVQPTLGNTFSALRLMALCGMDVRDEPVVRALDLIEQRYIRDGAISYRQGASGILPCYVGLTTRALIRMGATESPAVQVSLDWIVRHQRYDIRAARAGGDEPWSSRAVVNYGCWQKVSCYHGVTATLGALSAIPASERTPGQRERLGEAIEYLRAHRAYKRTTSEDPIFRTSTQFSLFHSHRPHLIDVLEWIIDADPAVGREPWVKAAIADVEALSVGGRIPLVTNGTTHLVDPLPFEAIGEPSKFLTLQWLRLATRLRLAH